MSERIQTTCPSCSAKVQVAARLAGKSLKCPKCHEAIVVPEATTADQPQPAQHYEQREAGVPQKSVATSHLAIVACALSAIACLLGVVAISMTISADGRIDSMVDNSNMVNDTAEQAMVDNIDDRSKIEALRSELAELELSNKELSSEVTKWGNWSLGISGANVKEWLALAKREAEVLKREADMLERLDLIEKRQGLKILNR